MKKIIILALVLCLSLCVFSGCGSSSSNWSGDHHVEMTIEGYGTITLKIDCDAAPKTAANFLNLVKQGFYNKTTIYRAIEGFAIYGGDPNRNGTGTSGTTIDGEFTANGVNNSLSNTKGAIGMARGTHYNSASCQFYILASDATYLDGDFAVFGNVISGQNVIDQIISGVEVTGSDGYISSANQPVISNAKIID